jgi:hypothetical protein
VCGRESVTRYCVLSCICVSVCCAGWCWDWVFGEYRWMSNHGPHLCFYFLRGHLVAVHMDSTLCVHVHAMCWCGLW